MARFLIIGVLFIFLLGITTPIYAKKVLPQAKSTSKTVSKKGASGISVSPKIRSDRRAIIVNFAGLQNANSVSYTLVYETNGQQEGAGGTIVSTGNVASRELLFGTCSKNVCRYHSNIKNARLEVTSGLKSGKTSTKRYRIKI